jgi:hypothetical protein
MKRFNPPKTVSITRLQLENIVAFFSLVGEVKPSRGIDAYIILNSDIKTAKNIDQFAKNMLWPSDNVAFCSILTPSYYHKERAGFHLIDKGLLLRNCEALIFPHDSLTSLIYKSGLSKKLLLNENVSSVLGLWAKRSNKQVFYYSPSLCQNYKQDGFNFVGEDYDVAKGVGQWRLDIG